MSGFFGFELDFFLPLQKDGEGVGFSTEALLEETLPAVCVSLPAVCVSLQEDGGPDLPEVRLESWKDLAFQVSQEANGLGGLSRKPNQLDAGQAHSKCEWVSVVRLFCCLCFFIMKCYNQDLFFSFFNQI